MRRRKLVAHEDFEPENMPADQKGWGSLRYIKAVKGRGKKRLLIKIIKIC